MLKIAAGTPFAIAAFSAMFTASVDLPIDGRPAMTMRSPGCRPVVLRSSWVKPVGHAADRRPATGAAVSSRSIVCGRMSRTATKPDRPRLPRSAISKTRRSASSTSSLRRPAAPVGRRGRDFVAGGDELPEDRALADDLGVGADVRRRRRVAGDRAEVGEAADLLEPALALEVLGNRDGVAGAADLRDFHDRLEDEPVVAAVEIRWQR